jgi:hypothetical protein
MELRCVGIDRCGSGEKGRIAEQVRRYKTCEHQSTTGHEQLSADGASKKLHQLHHIQSLAKSVV